MPQDPKFWEIPVDPSMFDALPAIELADEPLDEPRLARRREALNLLSTLVQTRLTAKQAEIVRLYFYEGQSQQQIAEALGVAQQVVSKHLFGAVRNGKKIGGAIERLRKLCAEAGVDPKKWV